MTYTGGGNPIECSRETVFHRVHKYGQQCRKRLFTIIINGKRMLACPICDADRIEKELAAETA